YRKSTEDELFDIFFKNKKIKVDKTKFFGSFDKVIFSSPKEYISFLLLAEAILKNEIEILILYLSQNKHKSPLKRAFIY
ncbi:TPA: hypothetical protein ACHU2X_001774, partial [Streptococcus suis]